MGWIEKLGARLGQKQTGGEKTSKDTWVILTLFGILLLVVFFPVHTGGTEKEEQTADAAKSAVQEAQSDRRDTADAGTAGQSYAAELEKRLEETLNCMDGAGRVKVMVTLQSSEEEIVEKDIPVNRSNTVENDAQGGNRSVNEYAGEENTVFVTDENGASTPYVVKKLEPAVEGVVVIAQGGGNERVCKNISDAIQALFGIEAHKIKIVKMKTIG